MATRIQITLSGAERSALAELAEMELRDLRDQLRHILRQELMCRGLLAPDGSAIDNVCDQTLHTLPGTLNSRTEGQR